MLPSRATAVAFAPNEKARLAEVQDYRIFGTCPEAQFDEITQLISTMLRTSIAVVSIIGQDSLWAHSCVGLDMREVPRSIAFCDHTIRGDTVLMVPDARRDPRFKENILVTHDPQIRFYAGAPLVTKNGFRVGALCVLDREPRMSWGSREEKLLRNFAGLVMTHLDLRRDRLAGRSPSQEPLDA